MIFEFANSPLPTHIHSAFKFNIPPEPPDSCGAFPFLGICVSSIFSCTVLGWEEASPRFSSKIFRITVRSSSLSAICKVIKPRDHFW